MFADQSIQTLASLPSWWTEITNFFKTVPFDVWGAIMWEESRFNPNAHALVTNPGPGQRAEDSVGLLQVNRLGGQGAGYSVAYLMNPLNNVRVGGPPILAAFNQYGDDVAQVAIHSGHPGLVDASDSRVQRIVRTSNWIKSIGSPLDAARQLLAGVTLPDPSSGSGSGLGASIAEGFWSAFTGGFSGWVGRTSANGLDGWIDALAPAGCTIVGSMFVLWGIQLAVLKSPPAQAAADAAIAAGPAPVKALGVAAKTVGGGVSSGSRAAAGAVTGELSARRARSAAQTRATERRERSEERERVAVARTQAREQARQERAQERERTRLAQAEARRSQGSARSAGVRRLRKRAS